MGQKVDWDYWRKIYVQGPDELDLRALAQMKGAPAYQSIRNKSSQEEQCWAEQRKRYRRDTTILASATPEVQHVAERIERIIDSAEMLTRHASAARQIGSIALKAFRSYDIEKIKPSEATQMMRLAIEVERICEGLATQRQQIDLSSMSDEQLQKLAEGDA